MVGWGDNSLHQLGILPEHPVKIHQPLILTSFESLSLTPVLLAAGGSHSLCVMENGNLYAWGTGMFGQLGLGDQLTACQIPTRVGSRKQAREMARNEQYITNTDDE